MKFLSRLKLPQIIILTAVLLVSAARIALAQETGKDKPKQSPYWREDPTSQLKTVEGGNENEMSAPRYAFFQTNTTFNAIGAGILDPTGQNQQAAVPLLGRSIAFLAGRPPVQIHEYLAYMAGKAGFIDQAYAQSQGGFDVLSPIQKLWVATRNVAYLITSLTLIVVGFMIMLRKKIDAQTVVGIEQALPNLVITLLLITFSYAIAGFVIDMIYFVLFFGIKLLALNNVFSDSGSAALEAFKTKSLFTIGLANVLRIGGPGNTGAIETAADAVGNLTENLFTDSLGGATGAVAQFLSQPIAFVIFAVAILYSIFKLFFSLLMAYIQIILLAILGPLQLMFNALPGSDAFSKWFRNLLANAMAFPAACIMIVFAAALMGQTGEPWNISDNIGFTDSDQGVKWTAPLIFGSGGGATNPVDAIQALLGMGILLMTPKVVDMVKEALQAPEFKYGSAIGEAVGASWGGVKDVAGRGYGATWGYGRERQLARQEAISEYMLRNAGNRPTDQQVNQIMEAKYPRGMTEGLRRRFGKFIGGNV